MAIVVDDGSTDMTELIEKFMKKIVLLIFVGETVKILLFNTRRTNFAHML